LRGKHFYLSAWLSSLLFFAAPAKSDDLQNLQGVNVRPPSQPSFRLISQRAIYKIDYMYYYYLLGAVPLGAYGLCQHLAKKKDKNANPINKISLCAASLSFYLSPILFGIVASFDLEPWTAIEILTTLGIGFASAIVLFKQLRSAKSKMVFAICYWVISWTLCTLLDASVSGRDQNIFSDANINCIYQNQHS